MSDADDFRARATEIFRQLRTGAGQPEGQADQPDDPESAQDENGSAADASGSDGTLTEGNDGPSEETQPQDIAPATANEADLDGADATSDSPVETAETARSAQSEPPEAPSQLPEAGNQTMGPLPGLSDEALQAFLDDSSSTVADHTGETITPPGAEGTEGDLPRADPLAGLELGGEQEPAPGDRSHPGSHHPLPRILAIANQKGGVGKTTTAVNLGAALAELGYRVLVTDLDPQGNATTGLGINARNLDASIYDVLLHDTPIEDVIEPTTLRNLFVVPATIDLAGAEIELVPMFSRELRLRRALETVRDDFDFVLIDCPPSLGLLTVNGLAAASEVVVPIQCEYYALEGLGQLLRNVNLVEGNLNQGLDLSTIILTMYDARTRLAEQVVNDVRKHFGSRVCRSVVPRTVRLSEAPSFGQPIVLFDSSSRGAIAYRELAKEVSGVAS